MKNLLIILYSLFLAPCSLFSQQNIEIYPSNWWVGMKWNKVQLMLHANNIGNYFHHVSCNYSGIKVEKVHTTENQNYLFVDISIAANAKPGNYKITCNTCLLYTSPSPRDRQ